MEANGWNASNAARLRRALRDDSFSPRELGEIARVFGPDWLRDLTEFGPAQTITLPGEWVKEVGWDTREGNDNAQGIHRGPLVKNETRR